MQRHLYRQLPGITIFFFAFAPEGVETGDKAYDKMHAITTYRKATSFKLTPQNNAQLQF
jgi:hypothetical protein